MDKFRIIEKTSLQFKLLVFVGSIKENSANIYKSQLNNEFVIYPQKGNNALLFSNKVSLDSVLSTKEFPLLDENKSIYLETYDLIKVAHNKMVNKDLIFDFIKMKFKLSKDFIDNESLFMIENEFKNFDSTEKKEVFPYLLSFFGCNFQNNINVNWESEKEEYLIPYDIPFLYDESNKISLYLLNSALFDKCINNIKVKTFKDIIINVYSDYYNKKFLLTNQNNYFDKTKYKKLLKNNFDKYFVFPFINTWNVPKI